MKFSVNLKRKSPRGRLVKNYSAFQNKIVIENNKYEFVGLNSKKFKFDKNHPIDILIQKSYDV